MACKFCGSDKTVKNGLAGGKQLYRCKDCNHQYLDNGAFTGMRTKAQVVACALNLYYDGLSTWKISRQIEKIFKVEVSAVSVWKWVMHFSELVSAYCETLKPQLGGKYHHDETEFKVGGEDKWFWEAIDEPSRFLVAHALTQSRTTKDAIAVFRQGLAKQRPRWIFTDGSYTYDDAIRKAFYTRYDDGGKNETHWVRRVGIQARQTNNVVERVHGTLKDRLRPARGLKHEATAKKWLDGYVVNYNFVKPHIALYGKTPAQAAGIDAKADWGDLIQDATIAKTKREVKVPMEVVAK